MKMSFLKICRLGYQLSNLNFFSAKNKNNKTSIWVFFHLFLTFSGEIGPKMTKNVKKRKKST